MSKRKIISTISLFIIILTSFRLIWLDAHQHRAYPVAKEGVLDLRDMLLEDNEVLPLDGEWSFFPEQFVVPDRTNGFSTSEHTIWTTVPGDWRQSFASNKNSSLGYGSYRLHILLNEEQQQPYRLRFTSIQTAAIVYINGEKIAESGHPSARKGESIPSSRPFSVSVASHLKELDLVVHVSNYEYSKSGGITQSVQFGTDTAVINAQQHFLSVQFMAASVLLLHSVYAILVYFISFRNREVLYLAAMFFSIGIAFLVDDANILVYLFPSISYDSYLKILVISYTASVYFLVQFLKKFLSDFKKFPLFHWFTVVCMLYMVLVACLPMKYFLMIQLPMVLLIIMFPIILVPIVILKVFSSEQRYTVYLLLSVVSMASSILWGVMNNLGWVDIPYYPFDLLISVICFASYWFKRLFQVSEESKERSEKLQQVDKKKDEFLANTSHELRNPLHAMLSIAQASLENDKKDSEEEKQKNLQLLITIGRRMSLILNDLLDLTKLKENQIRLQMSQVNLSAVVSGVFDMLRFMIEEKKIDFVMDIPNNFPNVVADENRLLQIIFNLVQNAVKFTHEGKIIVSTEIKKRMVIIHVKDTGIGMDEATMKRIFQPYEQGDSSMTAISGGIGLGLSICEQLIQLHGGTLSVSSLLKEGSTFTFTLPISNEVISKEAEDAPLFTAFEEVIVSTSEPQFISLNSERPRVLVVDDDPINRMILQQILSLDEYDVVTCTSGKEALDLLNYKRWDLVITDVMMPNMSGYELTKRIREHFSISELPILLLTARSQWEDQYTGFQNGANDYVTKPIDKWELTARVRALTDLKSSINEQIRMEAAWLQAQIQPHFLFNTLNTIAALSEINPTKMVELLHEFGNYLRVSFDTRNLELLVPLKHELDLVRSYVYIEQQRFADRLQVEWEMDEGLNIQVPPLALQTIVENAVNHGVLKNPHGGIVHIQIQEQFEFVEVIVTDDGVGMSEEKRQQLLHDFADSKRGIGLLNTDKRLKQLYGQGLVITSVLGQGTTVSFIIPKTI